MVSTVLPEAHLPPLPPLPIQSALSTHLDPGRHKVWVIFRISSYLSFSLEVNPTGACTGPQSNVKWFAQTHVPVTATVRTITSKTKL